MNRPQKSAGARAKPVANAASRSRVFTARAILTSAGELLDGGGLLVERGCIARVLASRGAVKRARNESGAQLFDLGDVVVTAAFVDAHSHLELSGFGGRLPRDGTFADWIRALLRERATRDGEPSVPAVRTGADRLIATGTTCSGDIDSSGIVAGALRGHPLRLRLYREVLDAGDSARSATALEALDREPRRRARTWTGVSPHAPYTVSEGLFRELGKRARRSRRPQSIHWAETREENEWLERGAGPMSALLKRSPHKRGLDLIEEAGLLGPRTTLIHGNHALAAERQRVAASGAVLVHCPGTHAFFGRPRFDLESWWKAGVPVALGTDSLASNEDLDMRREMKLLRRSHPKLEPVRVWDMATRTAALALGFGGRAGELVPGAWADLCAHVMPGESGGQASEVLEALTSAETRLSGVWIAGRAVGSHSNARSHGL